MHSRDINRIAFGLAGASCVVYCALALGLPATTESSASGALSVGSDGQVAQGNGMNLRIQGNNNSIIIDPSALLGLQSQLEKAKARVEELEANNKDAKQALDDLKRGEPERFLKFLKELNEQKTNQDNAEKIEGNREVAWVALYVRDIASAQTAADRVLALAPDDFEARLVKGIALYESPDYPAAKRWFQQMLTGDGGAPLSQKQSLLVHCILSLVDQSNKDLVSARAELAQAQALVDSNDAKANAVLCALSGSMLAQEGNIPRAEEKLRTALSLSNASTDSIFMASIESILSLLEQQQGHLDEAERDNEAAAGHAEQAGFEVLRAICLIRQADIIRLRHGDLDNAKSLYRLAASILENGAWRQIAGVAYGNLSEVEEGSGDLPAALDAADRAVICYRGTGRSVAYELEQVAYLCAKQKLDSRAEEAYKEAIAEFKKLSLQEAACRESLLLAYFYQSQGKIPDADAAFQGAIGSTESSVAGPAYANLGRIRFNDDKLDEAFSFCDSARAFLEHADALKLDAGLNLEELGYISIKQKKLPEAHDYFEKSLSFCEAAKSDEATKRINHILDILNSQK